MTPMQSMHRSFAIAPLAATAPLSQALHAQVSTYTSQVNVPFWLCSIAAAIHPRE